MEAGGEAGTLGNGMRPCISRRIVGGQGWGLMKVRQVVGVF